MTSAPRPASATSSLKHLRCPAALDRDDPTALEAERHRRVDQALDRVRNRQVDNEDAVRTVRERRDEHFAAREVGALAGLER